MICCTCHIKIAVTIVLYGNVVNDIYHDSIYEGVSTRLPVRLKRVFDLPDDNCDDCLDCERD